MTQTTGPFAICIDRTTRATMRDGVELGMVIVRPAAPGRFPAIMSYNPYRTLTTVKSEYSETDYNHRWDGPSWFAERGYAVVYFDVRGTGNSGGSTQSVYSAEERRDACEMVEWLAQQPWCDGNVGMWGMSYGGVVQWQVGVQNPPHLKALIAVPGPRIDFRSEMLKWYDRWLKGIENGVTDEPPLNLFVRTWTQPHELMPMTDAGSWHAETEWTPERVKSVTMYLADDQTLSEQTAAAPAQDTYAYDPTVGVTSGIYWGGGVLPWAMPLDQRPDEIKSLTFTTAPFERDTELTGEPRAVLYVSSTADSGYFHVKLLDVAPDGTSKWLADGGRLTSHRLSHTHPEPMVPGEVYELKINLKFIAYLVPAGHALRVSVASADLQNAWPCASPAVHSLHRGGDRPSHVVLPLAPANAQKLPAPALTPSPHPEPTANDFAGDSTHTITHDLVNQTVTIALERISGLPPNISFPRPAFGESVGRREARSRYTVSRTDPAATHLVAEHIYTIKRPEGEIRIEANESLASDAQMFRFQSRVDIRVDGKPHFTKSWRTSRPRLLD